MLKYLPMNASSPNIRAYIGLGSNLGDSLAELRAARRGLQQPPAIIVRASSGLYRTAPVGGPPGQPDYLNAVLAIDTFIEPEDLLIHCQALEATSGRRRDGERWAARTLDIDLLLYDDLSIQTPALTIPHPRLHLRRFVLAPLCDLHPQGRLPGDSSTFAEHLAAVEENQVVQRIAQLW